MIGFTYKEINKMNMEKMRDSIDFKNTDIKTLFRKLLLPTVLGPVWMFFEKNFIILYKDFSHSVFLP